MWEIIDNDSIIFSSSEEDEMRALFTDIVEKNLNPTLTGWNRDWCGDLRLIQVHAIYK